MAVLWNWVSLFLCGPIPDLVKISKSLYMYLPNNFARAGCDTNSVKRNRTGSNSVFSLS